MIACPLVLELALNECRDTWLPEGRMLLAIGPACSTTLSALIEATAANDICVLSRLARASRARTRSAHVRAVAEFYCHEMLLARSAIPSGSPDAFITVIPYDGDRITASDFRLVAYDQNGNIPGLRSVVVLRRPVQCGIETTIQERLSGEVSEIVSLTPGAADGLVSANRTVVLLHGWAAGAWIARYAKPTPETNPTDAENDMTFELVIDGSVTRVRAGPSALDALDGAASAQTLLTLRTERIMAKEITCPCRF
jgi:hypothetical protein